MLLDSSATELSSHHVILPSDTVAAEDVDVDAWNRRHQAQLRFAGVTTAAAWVTYGPDVHNCLQIKRAFYRGQFAVSNSSFYLCRISPFNLFSLGYLDSIYDGLNNLLDIQESAGPLALDFINQFFLHLHSVILNSINF